MCLGVRQHAAPRQLLEYSDREREGGTVDQAEHVKPEFSSIQRMGIAIMRSTHYSGIVCTLPTIIP